MIDLQQSWPKPESTKNIVFSGAGSIVSDAHLPAYKKAGLNLVGLYDPDQQKAGKLAALWDIESYSTLKEETQHISSVEDAWQTMALVEAAYTSSAMPATPIASLPER